MGASYIAFSFARWSARDWVTVRIPSRMHRYDDRLETGGIWPVVLLRLVFGQLPPADWLLGVTKVSTRNFLIGTGIGIIPGVVLFVIAGGGLIEFFTDLSTSTRRILLAVIVTVGGRSTTVETPTPARRPLDRGGRDRPDDRRRMTPRSGVGLTHSATRSLEPRSAAHADYGHRQPTWGCLS